MIISPSDVSPESAACSPVLQQQEGQQQGQLNVIPETPLGLSKPQNVYYFYDIGDWVECLYPYQSNRPNAVESVLVRNITQWKLDLIRWQGAVMICK